MQAARPVLLCLVLFLSILGCSSCHSSSGKGEESSAKKQAIPDPFPAAQEAQEVISKPDSSAKYMGVYSGSFGDEGIITLVLNYISGRTVSGYDVHKGLRRNINGEVTRVGGKLHFVLKEPGDNRFDGTFDFLLDMVGRKIEGEWVMDNPAVVVSRRVSITLMPLEWNENYGDEEWNHADTALDFHNNGTCKLEITPAYGYAQKVVVRGNFNKKKDTFLIEWEKNPYIAGSAKMVEYSKTVADGKGDSTYRLCLKGGGMELVAREEPSE